MLSIPVRRDIAQYKSKIFGKLTIRTLILITIAGILALGFGFWANMIVKLPVVVTNYLIIIITAPAFAAGFWHPYHMNLEQFIPLYVRHHFTNNRLHLVSTTYKIDKACADAPIKQTKGYARLKKRERYLEAISPTDMY